MTIDPIHLEQNPEVCRLLEQITHITPKKANAVADTFLNTIGNNHSGVYWVEYHWAIAFLVEYYNHSDPNSPQSIAIYGILNDLYYFEPIEKHPTNRDNTTIKEELEQLLAPFADNL
ncbi:MAG: hypothetical protein Q3983_02285 [Capnocytophaga sp.]|nr:hypothetical protein [Capnocytophaga sp.]